MGTNPCYPSHFQANTLQPVFMGRMGLVGQAVIIKATNTGYCERKEKEHFFGQKTIEESKKTCKVGVIGGYEDQV